MHIVSAMTFCYLSQGNKTVKLVASHIKSAQLPLCFGIHFEHVLQYIQLNAFTFFSCQSFFGTLTL